MVLNFYKFSLNENIEINAKDLISKLSSNELNLEDLKNLLIGKKICAYEKDISKKNIFIENETIINIELKTKYQFNLLFYDEWGFIKPVAIFETDIIVIQSEPNEIKEEDIEWF
jgi:hypothetical protein